MRTGIPVMGSSPCGAAGRAAAAKRAARTSSGRAESGIEAADAGATRSWRDDRGGCSGGHRGRDRHDEKWRHPHRVEKENFRVLDDGAPQTITNFAPTDAPITMVVLMEFSGRAYGWFAAYAKYWADALFPNLQQKDWVALETFDMKTRLEVDFTQDKNEVRAAINHLYFPGFSESNVFDAILETNERLKDVKGKKSILLLASGVDTFSKHTLDQTMKQLRQSDVTIFAVGLGKTFTNALDMHGSRGAHMDYLQAENQLKTFANETGGFSWFPQFDGEIPGIFQQVAAMLRHQYSISYTPGNGAKDGRFHKVKVELVAPDGGPLNVVDQKGKKQKYVVYAREGYQAPKSGVGD